MGLIGFPSGDIQIDVYSTTPEILDEYIMNYLKSLKEFEKKYEHSPEKQLGNYRISKSKTLNGSYKCSIRCLLWHSKDSYREVKSKLLSIGENIRKENSWNDIVIEIEKVWKTEPFSENYAFLS